MLTKDHSTNIFDTNEQECFLKQKVILYKNNFDKYFKLHKQKNSTAFDFNKFFNLILQLEKENGDNIVEALIPFLFKTLIPFPIDNKELIEIAKNRFKRNTEEKFNLTELNFFQAYSYIFYYVWEQNYTTNEIIQILEIIKNRFYSICQVNFNSDFSISLLNSTIVIIINFSSQFYKNTPNFTPEEQNKLDELLSEILHINFNAYYKLNSVTTKLITSTIRDPLLSLLNQYEIISDSQKIHFKLWLRTYEKLLPELGDEDLNYKLILKLYDISFFFKEYDLALSLLKKISTCKFSNKFLTKIKMSQDELMDLITMMSISTLLLKFDNNRTKENYESLTNAALKNIKELETIDINTKSFYIRLNNIIRVFSVTYSKKFLQENIKLLSHKRFKNNKLTQEFLKLLKLLESDLITKNPAQFDKQFLQLNLKLLNDKVCDVIQITELLAFHKRFVSLKHFYEIEFSPHIIYNDNSIKALLHTIYKTNSKNLLIKFLKGIKEKFKEFTNTELSHLIIGIFPFISNVLDLKANNDLNEPAIKKDNHELLKLYNDLLFQFGFNEEIMVNAAKFLELLANKEDYKTIIKSHKTIFLMYLFNDNNNKNPAIHKKNISPIAYNYCVLKIHHFAEALIHSNGKCDYDSYYNFFINKNLEESLAFTSVIDKEVDDPLAFTNVIKNCLDEETQTYFKDILKLSNEENFSKAALLKAIYKFLYKPRFQHYLCPPLNISPLLEKFEDKFLNELGFSTREELRDYFKPQVKVIQKQIDYDELYLAFTSNNINNSNLYNENKIAEHIEDISLISLPQETVISMPQGTELKEVEVVEQKAVENQVITTPIISKLPIKRKQNIINYEPIPENTNRFREVVTKRKYEIIEIISHSNDINKPWGNNFPARSEVIKIGNSNTYAHIKFDNLKFNNDTQERKFKDAAEKKEFIRDYKQSGFTLKEGKILKIKICENEELYASECVYNPATNERLYRGFYLVKGNKHR
ncbi:MAG: hypothetical protein J0H68_08135 [Sphingobacteriia bacterium]|nr:hypothetical protein [Sphingobacteriia bacterium]